MRMDKSLGMSSNMVYGRRVFPLILALVACLMWVSAAHAQEAPFNSQYDPPPTTPPECDYSSGDPGSGDDSGTNDKGDDANSDDGTDDNGDGGVPASGCEPPPVSDAEGPIDILPTTGGLLAAPVLLGAAAIFAAGIFAVRRKR
jgi:hypothetical protein